MNRTLALLVAISGFLCLCVAQTASDKVQIDLYDESLCPYCRSFVTGQLKAAFNTANLSLIADLNVWPYGNARESQSGSTFVFTCQHGAEECAGNLMEACALYKLNKNDYLNFSICLESQIDQSGTFAKAGPICAKNIGVDFAPIQSCLSGAEGNQYQHQVAQKTASLNPPHQYVPWITVNGAHDETAEDQITQDAVGFICKTYKGTIQIPACQNRTFHGKPHVHRGRSWNKNPTIAE